MRRLAASVLVLSALGAPVLAHADCLTIPDGVGGAAVHCADGTVGHLRLEPGGVVTGMIGAQSVLAPAETVTVPGLAGVEPIPAPLSPDVAPKPPPPPSLAPPRPQPEPPGR